MERAGVVAFAFGDTLDDIPPNRLISRLALKKAWELSARVYTDLKVCCDSDILVTYTDEKPSKPWPTLRTARGAVTWAKKNELNELWLVAAKPHLWRCMRDLMWAVQEEESDIKVHVCHEIIPYHDSDWFSQDSSQKYTRSRADWKKRDLILKIMPFWLYRLLAS